MLCVLQMETNEPQNRFILGLEPSHSTHSPLKSRWSRQTSRNSSLRFASRNSPTKPYFTQMRNRSYALAVSPQKQVPVARPRRNSRLSFDRKEGHEHSGAESSTVNLSEDASAPTQGRKRRQRTSQQKDKSARYM